MGNAPPGAVRPPETNAPPSPGWQKPVASSPITGNDGPLQPSGASGGIFSRSWTVTADTPIPNVNRVAVTVTWRDRPNTSSVTLVTLVPL